MLRVKGGLKKAAFFAILGAVGDAWEEGGQSGVMGDGARKRSEDSMSKEARAENGVERRHDDLLWKDLLARFFVPFMIRDYGLKPGRARLTPSAFKKFVVI